MDDDLFISVITRSEFLVDPYRKNDDESVQAFFHFATAEELNCTIFLTNDKQLRQFESATMQIVLVDDLQ
ncbi:MAG: hypothetical protein VZQ80_10300 [Lachnospiraceae bacterium]|nr:hypothetical protein [Lachnospiraceae bacterium]